MGAQNSLQAEGKRVILEAFRNMSDECRRDALAAMQAWAEAFPRRRPASLSLVKSTPPSTAAAVI